MGRTQKSPTITFDWIGMTFPDMSGIRDELLCCLARDKKWIRIGGAYGYSRGVQYGDIRIYDGGNRSIYIELRGKGCRQLETDCNLGSERSWQIWFENMRDFGGRPTRIDIAIDDKSGIVKMKTIMRKVQNCDLTTSFRKDKSFTVRCPKTGKHQSSGVEFGTRHSDINLLIYDKAFEQGIVGSWLRLEYRVRNHAARLCIDEFILGGFDSIAFDIRARLVFRVRNSDVQDKRLWNECLWWTKLVRKVLQKQEVSVQKCSCLYSQDQLLQSRALISRAFQEGGKNGLLDLWQRSVSIAESDLQEAVRGLKPTCRHTKMKRHFQKRAARAFVERSERGAR